MKQIFKRIIYAAIFIEIVFISNAQEMHSPLVKLTPASNSLNYKLPGIRYYVRPSYMGSEFLTEKWCPANLVLENGDRYDSILVRLNSYLDELIEYNNRINATIMLDKAAISGFDITFEDGLTGHFQKIYFDKFPKGDRYFSILYEGKLKALLWYKTIETQTSVYVDPSGFMHNTEFVLTRNYYIEFPGGEIVKFALKRRSFLQVFPEHKKQVRRLLRKNDVLLKTEDDISKAVSLIEKEVTL